MVIAINALLLLEWSTTSKPNLIEWARLDFCIIGTRGVIVENCDVRLAHAQTISGRAFNPNERLQRSARCVPKHVAVLYGQLNHLVVYLPILP